MVSSDELTERFRDLRVSLDALPEVSEPPKPMLRILGSTRSEQTWNTLLAYFLDPSQPHGFGADLLKQFLDKATAVTDCDIEYYHRDLEQVTVETEVTSPQDNRLDIVIRVPERWFVCLECKVDASEGHRQTQRYIEDTHLGSEPKERYPGNHHYLFLSKQYTADSAADGFADIYWRDVVEAFQNKLQVSRGQYPTRSVSQLDDFLSTVISVTNMADDDFEQTQKEKVRLLGEYRDDIDELLEAAESLRQRAVDEWPQLFRAQLADELWTEEWTTRSEPREWGCLFQHGWYLDDDNLEPTTVAEETHGSTGFRLHFNHLIRNEESFSRGTLTYRLRTPTAVPLRDAFYEAYHTDRWQAELQPLFDEKGIENIGNKKNYMRKTYDVDHSGLPESYFQTLATAFEEHLEVAEVIDQILADAIENLEQEK